MDVRVISLALLCGLLAHPARALGNHQLINPRKSGGVQHDSNPLGAPASGLAPMAPAPFTSPSPGRSEIDKGKTGGAAHEPGTAVGSADGPRTSPPASTQPDKAPPRREGTYRVTGTITSVSDSRLVVSNTVRGKKTTSTFILDPRTIKQGTLKPGARATVTYRFEKSDKVARRVEVPGTKAPAKSGAKPSGRVSTSKP